MAARRVAIVTGADADVGRHTAVRAEFARAGGVNPLFYLLFQFAS